MIIFLPAALFVAIVVTLALANATPRPIDPRNGLYKRQWWRFGENGTGGGGYDPPTYL